MNEGAKEIILGLDTSAIAKGMGGLEKLHLELKAVRDAAKEVQAALNGMGSSGAGRSVKELEASIKGLQGKGVGLSMGELSKGLGLQADAFERHVRRMKNSADVYNATQNKFLSVPKAARAIASFEKVQGKVTQAALSRTLNPTVASVQAAAAEAVPSGPVNLKLSAAQVQASVEGIVQLRIPASQVAGAVDVERDASGRFVPGGGAGGGGGGGKSGKNGKKGSGKAAFNKDVGANELSRTIIETEDARRAIIREAGAAGETITTTFDSVEGELRKATRTDAGKQLLDDLQHKRRLMIEGFRKEKAKLLPGDLLGLGNLQTSTAGGLRGLIDPKMKEALGEKGFARVGEIIEAKAGTLEASGATTRSRGLAKSDKERREVDREQLRRDNKAALIRRQRAQQQKERADLGAEEKKAAAVEQASRNNQAAALRRHRVADREKREAQEVRRDNKAALIRRQRAQQQKERADLRAEEKKAAAVEQASRNNQAAALRRHRVADREKREAQEVRKAEQERKNSPAGKLAAAAEGFSPMGIVTNTVKVAGWAAAVTVLYKSMELAGHAIERVIEIGGQTARLEQIFKGVGGSAQELTQDILGVAAANGRATEEAMESGIAWARLGLTRAEVNEGVRVSTMAANVANVDMATSTKYLSAIMQVYGLNVYELDGVLGMLNNTSNKFNVTNRDLFDGITRTASVAKQWGLSLPETIGAIGAAVGKSGQTGSQIGNAFKSMITHLNAPENAVFLRKFGVETQSSVPGEMRSGSQVLRELWTAYQGLNQEERKSINQRLAGTTQASRFVAIMDSYVQGQKLAIDAQLNLNSAEQENARILAQQKAQLAGVGSAWDKLVVTMGNAKGGSVLMGSLSGNSINEQLVVYERWLKVVLELGGKLANLSNLAGGSLGKKNIFAQALQQTMNPLGSAIEGAEEFMHPGIGQFQSDMQAAQQKTSFAGGMRTRGNLFRAVAGSLEDGRESNARNVEGLIPGGELESLVKQNKLVEARAMLTRAAAQAESDGMNSAHAAEEQLSATLARVQEQRKASVEGSDRQKKELDAEINDILHTRQAILDEDTQEPESEARLQRTISLIEREKVIVEELGRLWEQMPVQTASQKLENQIQLLKEQEFILSETYNKLPPLKQAGEAGIGLETQRREVEGRRSALEANRGLAGLQDDRAVAFRRAQLKAEGMGVGRNEAEKLLNREKALQEELGKLRRKSGPLSDNEAARGLALENELLANKQKIQERILFLRAQEKQLIFDANREFQKNLLFAGPGELLKMLAVKKMDARGGMNAGSFFAMDPESRRVFDTLHGGESGRTNRSEQNFLRGRGQTVEQEQRERRGLSQFAGTLGEHQTRIANGGGGVPELVTAAKAAAGNLSAVAKSAAQVNSIFTQLPQIVANLVGAALNAAKPSMPRLNTGHSLGSQGAADANAIAAFLR